MFLLAIATLAASCVYAQNSTNFTVTDVEQAFQAAKIVPDVLPSFNPTGILNVVFLDNTTGTSVNVTPGANLTREQNALRPQVFLTTNDTSLAQQTFVLAMVDPDAPTPQNPTEAQIRHLLAPGIQANGSVTSGAALVNNTPAISDFLRPTPPAGSDPHRLVVVRANDPRKEQLTMPESRYILLLFVQPANFTTVAPQFVNSSTPISNFNISLFAQEVGLGSPIAGNFFLTGPDANSTNSTNSTSTASGAASSSTSPASSNTPSSSMRLEINSKLPPGANRILFVKNLNYQITGEDLYDLFGRYGSIRQIRIGNDQKTRGTAFVVFDDVMDAKNALDHLNGFHLQERYIVVLYHMPAKQDAAAAKAEIARREEELAQLKKRHDIKDED
ncbi:LOW QUALITY PROTEIN: hypothetical protein ACG7TL_003994 [Trametes sanguinea]